MIAYEKHSPPPHLAPWIETVWTLRGRLDRHQRVLPDGCVELILHRGAPMIQEGRPQPRHFVAGQMDRCLSLDSHGKVDTLGVRFHPFGATAFFGVPMHMLTNRFVQLEAILGDNACRAFNDSAALWRVLEARLRNAPRPDPAVVCGARLIVAAQGAISIDEVARRMGAGPRQLDRLFQQYIGIPPKLFARIQRFQHVFQVWDQGNWNRLADLAVECGFYDQAHMCHEFARFSGRSPLAFFERPEVMARLFLRQEGSSDSYKPFA